MRKAFLDTNAYRKLFDGDSNLLEQVELLGEIYMSPIILGELFAGFRKGNSEKRNLMWLSKFLESQSVEVKEIGVETARMYAQIKNALEQKGKPIPTNDMWIAAQAMELGATLITFDRHFEEIEGLRVFDA
jgi:tRNA(fMet)-specific endonuclease VapC